MAAAKRNVIEIADITLSKLAARINFEHAAVIEAVKRGIEHALTAGELLIEAKEQVGHGNWLPWLAEHCPDINERTARRYMHLARNREELASKSVTMSDLTMKAAAELLGPEPDDADDPLDDVQKDKIRAMVQHFKWGPEAIAKALKLPLEDVRRFLQPDDDDDEPRKKSQQLGGSGDDEYFTPSKYVEAVRDVLGVIDIDPASCVEAQATVRAERYFTKEDDGLKQEWQGRVFLNSPWSDPLPWVQKLIREYRSGRVTEAVMLTTSNTSARWFQEAAAVASAICFTNTNIAFIHKTKGQMGRSAIGQAFLYYGPDVEKFARRFAEIGSVVTSYKPRKTATVSSLEATRLSLVSVTALQDWLRQKVA